MKTIEERRQQIRDCVRAYRATPEGKAKAAAYEATPERMARKRAITKAWHAAHPGASKAYYAANRDKIRARVRLRALEKQFLAFAERIGKSATILESLRPECVRPREVDRDLPEPIAVDVDLGHGGTQ